MPNNTWPAGIADAFSADSFAEVVQDTNIRTQMETGPAKTRRRFTNASRQYSCSVILHDATEYQALRDFYDITCQNGTDSILMPHPITGVMTEFWFASTIVTKAIGIAWEASFTLEYLP